MRGKGCAVAIALWLAAGLGLLAEGALPPGPEGVFVRVPWADELPQSTLDSWLDLVRVGRAAGPGSPYYLSSIALQNVACNQAYPIGPPCNSSAPTFSKQAHGHSNLPYGTVWAGALKKLEPFFDEVDTLYVGTIFPDGWDPANHSSNVESARQQGAVAAEFVKLYPDLHNMAWYLCEEGTVDGIGLSATLSAQMADYLRECIQALYAVRPGLPLLWSPAFGTPYSSHNASQLQAMEDNLVSLFCALPQPIRLHPQDCLGQTVSFEFPFFFNYTNAFTCEGNSVPYYALLERVRARCPHGISEVKMNMEMFVERLSPSGQRGEDSGANIVNANPYEIAQRMQCYQKHSLPIGVSWAMPHWHDLFTFANSTVYAPY